MPGGLQNATQNPVPLELLLLSLLGLLPWRIKLNDIKT